METEQIFLQTDAGKALPSKVLVVPTIAAPLMNKFWATLTKLPYLQHLPLAYPVSDSLQFETHLFIGADHYWDIIEYHVVCGNDPTAVRSKFGYLLSGR